MRFNKDHVWPFWYFIHTCNKRCLSCCQLLIMSRVKANTWRGFLCLPTLPRYPTPSSFTAPKTTFKQSQCTTAKVSSSSAIWKRVVLVGVFFFFFNLLIGDWFWRVGWGGISQIKIITIITAVACQFLAAASSSLWWVSKQRVKYFLVSCLRCEFSLIANWLHPYFCVTHFHLFECKSCLMGRSSVRE